MGFKPLESNQKVVHKSSLPFNIRQFIEDVLNEEYILVVGSEVIMSRDVETTGDVNNYILSSLCKMNKLSLPEYKDFNEYASRLGRESDPIRDLLNGDQFTFDLNDVSSELKAFLSTKRFPIVLTTTFDGYLEALMRSIWGNALNVVNIDDSSAMRDLRDDIKSYRGRKYDKPTLMYIFGKAEKDISKKYVHSDDDAIVIIDKWMNFPKVDPIIKLINNRKILALGCKFDNWYFRFFWYILKREISRFREGQVAFMLDINNPIDCELHSFLEKSNIYRHENARLFMKDIADKLDPSDENSPFNDLILKKRREGGIFLSYCSKNLALASQLFFQLNKRGFNVWFDVHNVQGGDKLNPVISEAIAKAKIFVPLLTPEIAQDLENRDYHYKENGEYKDKYYIQEWKLATQLNDKIILPLAAGGYDLKKEYHRSVYKDIVYKDNTKDESSGIDLMKDGFEKLIESLDSKLSQMDNYEQ